jgi:hypothetical protein
LILCAGGGTEGHADWWTLLWVWLHQYGGRGPLPQPRYFRNQKKHFNFLFDALEKGKVLFCGIIFHHATLIRLKNRDLNIFFY